MRFNIETKALKEGLRTISALFTNHKGNKGECLITAADNQVKLESAAEGAYLKLYIPATVFEEGFTVLGVKNLASLRPGRDVTFELRSSRLLFSSGALKGYLETTQNAQQFISSRPKSVIDTPVNIAHKELLNATRSVYFQPSLVSQVFGIRVQVVKEGPEGNQRSILQLSSSDSFRVALCTHTLKGDVPEFDAYVHSQTLWNTVNRLNGPLQLGSNKKLLRIKAPNFDLYYPLIATKPMDCKQWVEKLGDTYHCKLDLDAYTMLQNINQASSVIGGAISHEVRLNCIIKPPNEMEILVKAPNGEAKSKVTLLSQVASPLTLKLSSRYTTELLGLLGQGKVEVRIWNNPPALVLYSSQHQTLYVMPQARK